MENFALLAAPETVNCNLLDADRDRLRNLGRRVEELQRRSPGEPLSAVTLTSPQEISDSDQLTALRAIVALIPWPGDTGVWFVPDRHADGHLHWHGIVLGGRPRDVVERWLAVVGGEPGAQSVERVWLLRGWLDYSTKNPGWAERIVAAGSLDVAWRDAGAPLGSMQGPHPNKHPNLPRKPPTSAREHSPSEAWRRCSWCTAPMHRADYRRHAVWCGASCKVMASRERRALEQGLTLAQLDEWRERAAILEFEAGLGRREAEHRAWQLATTSSGRVESARR
jgi:hypothetical protein